MVSKTRIPVEYYREFPSCNKDQRKNSKGIAFVVTYHPLLKQLKGILRTINQGDFVSWGTLTTLMIFCILFNRTIHKDFVKTYKLEKFNLGISKGNTIQK